MLSFDLQREQGINISRSAFEAFSKPVFYGNAQLEVIIMFES